MPHSIQHIAMNCANLKLQEQFYSKHFGFKLARTFNKGKPDEFVMLRMGGACIELFQAGPEYKARRAGEQPVGFKHLALEVNDIEQTIGKLRADGVKTDDIIDCSSMVPGLRVCFFDDPEGNRIEIMQGWSDE